jgi:Trypsin
LLELFKQHQGILLRKLFAQQKKVTERLFCMLCRSFLTILHARLALSALKQVYLKGDTGGPVIYTYSGDSTPTVVGINSQNQGCPSEYPMAYTKIQPYLPWIQRIVPDLLL